MAKDKARFDGLDMSHWPGKTREFLAELYGKVEDAASVPAAGTLGKALNALALLFPFASQADGLTATAPAKASLAGQFHQTAMTFALAATHTLLATGTAAANQTLLTGNLLFIDPTANRDLKLPPEAEWVGYLMISNRANAAETITVKDDSGVVTVISLAQNKSGLLFCDGTSWAAVLTA